MVSALAYAYHLTHLEKPLKAVALLQTSADALELRPENLLALQESKMASEHKDLLTFDELIIKPIELGHRIKGLALGALLLSLPQSASTVTRFEDCNRNSKTNP